MCQYCSFSSGREAVDFILFAKGSYGKFFPLRILNVTQLMKKHYLAAALASGAVATQAQAASISVNLSENDGNQAWTGTEPVGPLGTPENYFNTTNNPTGGDASLPVRTGDLVAGSMSGLVSYDSVTGTATSTSAAVTWASSNTWWTDEGLATPDTKLSVGYLDDGGDGVSITVTDVPYASYEVIALIASDYGNGGATYTHQDVVVNGEGVFGSTWTAFGTTVGAGGWTQATLDTPGNYVVSGIQTDSTLTISLAPRNGDIRGSITGFIINEASAAVPEPSSALLLLMGCAGILRRRR